MKKIAIKEFCIEINGRCNKLALAQEELRALRLEIVRRQAKLDAIIDIVDNVEGSGLGPALKSVLEE